MQSIGEKAEIAVFVQKKRVVDFTLNPFMLLKIYAIIRA
jgi:hypothetical protein